MNFRTTTAAVDLCGAWSFAYSPVCPVPPPATAAAVRRAGLSLHPCLVPGALETDLEAIGELPELFHGLNILRAQDYERHHVWYARSFTLAEIPAGTDPQLVLEGLDCFAEVYLNGIKIASLGNMLVAHEISATGLRVGENELLVHLRPAVVEAEQYEYPVALAALPVNQESLHVRKAPHMYGWDIMPRAVSAGIWRPVSVRFLPTARLEDVYMETTALAAEATAADLILHYRARLKSSQDRDHWEIAVQGVCGTSTFTARRTLAFGFGRLAIRVEDPRRWWPRGWGRPELYAVEVSLLHNGTLVDRMAFNHGIRTVEVRRTSVTDEQGNGEFCFVVNAERIFIKGTNWVPADAFHWRDAQRIPRILPMVEECHCNMLRCWGGNVYESDAFFDWCDAHGILVWQDFAMGCAVYPQDARFQETLRAEARQVVKRLRQHASLALWAGDNECDQAHAWFRAGDPNRNVLTRRVLAEVLKEEDPQRPYLPSSPYIDETAYTQGERYLPENHLWGPRGYYKADFYTQALCHFVSEIGYHGCPEVESLRRFISPEKLWPPLDNDEWILHSTNPTLEPGRSWVTPQDMRVKLMIDQIRHLFGDMPARLEEFSRASQAVQAEAMKFFIERFRGGKGRRTGILWWNLMDGWPQFSDAVVDYYFNKKAAFHAIRRAQEDVGLLLREPAQGKQELVAVNDTRAEVAVVCSVRDVDQPQGELFSAQVTIPAHGLVVVGSIPFEPSVQRMYALRWTWAGRTARNHYLAGQPPFSLARYLRWMDQLYGDEPA